MPAERDRRSWWASLLGLVLAAEGVQAQEPVSPPRKIGPIRRAFRHVARTVHEDFIGDPDLFAEPPLGAPLNETIGLMRAKAAPHYFTLYRSDFLVDSTALSPSGLARMSRICGGLRGWLGPVVVEPTLDRPGLAESRRAAVVALLNEAGHPVGLERVVIAPAVGPGALGTDAANNYQILITRDQAAPTQFSVTPTASTSPGGGGGR
jgi:hypothetical protein